MFIELSEALVCPACGPPQGLVVVVDVLDGRRVLDGFLGCPACEARFPVRTGVVDLGQHPAAGPVPEPDPDVSAVMLAALFDVRQGGGYLLLDEVVWPLAAAVAELTGGCEVIALAGDASGHVESGTAGRARADPPAPGANRVEGAGATLPVQSGRLRAIALGWPTETRLRDAVRALGAGGRLVVIRPTDEVRALLRELPVQPIADEASAFLGVVAPSV